MNWTLMTCYCAPPLDLCLYGNVGADNVVEGLASADTSCIRLVLFKGCAYIEYSEWLDRVDNAPVQRFVLPSRSARYADLALSAGKRLEKTAPLPTNLDGVAEAIGVQRLEKATLFGLLRSLSKDVRQENAFKFPGVVAGVLAGTQKAAALPSREWIRVITGQARTDPSTEDDEEPEAVIVKDEEMVSPRLAIGVVSLRNREKSKIANRSFLGEIRSVLTDYLASRTRNQKTAEGGVTRNTRTNTDTAARRDARSAVERVLRKPDPSVSVTVYALGTWVLHLLYRPYRKGYLDAASIKRYLDTLSHGFVSFGHSLDLADLDGDELTDLYRSVLDGSKGSETTDSNEQDHNKSAEQKGRRNEKYVLQRLEEFHRFASARFGLESPDWAEIGEGVVSSLSNPGTICEQEYLQALRLLCPDTFTDDVRSVRDAFILLLAYRFGLRGGEAIGLRHTDWVNLASAVVVLVTGKHRQLKTRGSQRQVPLLERLTDHEEMIIRCWNGHWVTETGNDQTVPLFFDEHNHRQASEIQPIRARILASLRAATKNGKTTLHHARHSFANRAFQYLVLESQNNPWGNHHNQNAEIERSAKLTVLSTDRATRRSSWGVARLLGHASHSTTFGSYLHVHFDWASNCVSEHKSDLFQKIALRTIRSAIDLDKWIIVPNVFQLTPIDPAPKYATCTPSKVLKYCRLRAQGYPSRAAIDLSHISPNDGQSIEASLAEIGQRQSKDTEGDNPLSSIKWPLALLGRIPHYRWQPLIDFTQARAESTISLNPRNSKPSQQIGNSRQLLLWSEDHFIQLREFIQWTGLHGNHIDVYRPKKIDPKTLDWAKTYGFEKLKDTHSAEGKKIIQVDLAIEKFSKRPAVIHPSRVAVVINAATPTLKDNYEFLLVWLAFTLSQASINSEGALMRSKDNSS
ncbi:MAG: tyrosine-type recombinase/integrase [Hydrogenophaga sp.]|nr:tyrosine-type recombinase/integrase [Hydrogenophaga sp.]